MHYSRFDWLRTRGQERETAVNIVAAREKGATGAGENLWLCFGNQTWTAGNSPTKMEV